MTYDTTLESAKRRPEPRKRDAEATRAAIVDAAKIHFARSGYEGAFLRDIAADAGVDAALINRYFGGKEGLFGEALKQSIRPEGIAEWDRENFGRDIATMMAGSPHEREDRTSAFQFLLRAATSPTTQPMLNEAVQQRFMGPIRDWLGGEAAPVRARIVASVFIGLLVERLVRDEPVPKSEREAFIERLAPILQALVDN
ncbi:MAG TPA: TetR family transcriptional regulator [Rhizomicrobium sp.]|jgi:AcrR family transcriptional regulator